MNTFNYYFPYSKYPCYYINQPFQQNRLFQPTLNFQQNLPFQNQTNILKVQYDQFLQGQKQLKVQMSQVSRNSKIEQQNILKKEYIFEQNLSQIISYNSIEVTEQNLKNQTESNQYTQQKKKIRQTPNRNVITNMCHKLINFISNKKKSKKILQKIKPQWRQYQYKSFYSFCIRMKNRMGNYINKQKFKNILQYEVNKYEQFNRLVRILSEYYLNNIYVAIILNSRKIMKQGKMKHLGARGQFLRIIRNG